MKLKLLLAFYCLCYFATAQDRTCGNQEYYNLYKNRTSKQESSTFRTSALIPVEGVVTIPVVVHVIYNNKAATNISDEQIYSQIQALNEDYRRKAGSNGYNTDPVGADVEINFCLANTDPSGNYSTGINRVYNSTSFWSIDQDQTIKGLSYWPSDQYLNVWVVSLSSRWLAYSQFPEVASLEGLMGPYSSETDGIVVHYEAFGTVGTAKSPYHLGRTLTHELGHWLGLKHIWGDTNCGDDYVDDTPQDAANNSTRTCSDSSDCNKDGKFTKDMANNYLDYSYDKCMNIFTLGQKERMRIVLAENPRRNALLASQGCNRLTQNISEAISSGFQIFPNPADDQLNLKFNVSTTGKVVLLNSLNEEISASDFSQTDFTSISLLNLASGFYFIVIETEKGKFIQKVIKK